jgi:hypothetical protein
MAFGTVVFILEAESDKAAFAKWKQVVFSGRQWIVKSNTLIGKVKEEPTVVQRLMDRLEDQESL